ncbi:GIY-YIG nuclease family protein [Gudongella sp. SC589]|uniref:GIY-YIG nuclease family protein n=1 Tax=Gudongella sp. SC589 TaxID=3385990 RepID=UPI0039047738
MDRKRELKREYKETKPDMGVYMIRSRSTGKTYIESTRNLKSGVNRARFTLNFGSHMHNGLQEDWKDKGEKDFEMEILETLVYREDDLVGDYTEELELLLSMWKERLLEEGVKLY